MGRIIQGILVAAAVTLATPVLAQQFDGTWVGKWGGQSDARIRVEKNKVTSYRFMGRPQVVGQTKIQGNTLSFGDDYVVRMTLTGARSADAHYSGRGAATAKLSRQ